jgi:hypothetical protein
MHERPPELAPDDQQETGMPSHLTLVKPAPALTAAVPSGRADRPPVRHGRALLALLAVLLGAGLAPAQGAPLQRFDGRWSVLVVTDLGDCSIYRYGVIVDRGQARYAGSADFTISGSIATNGAVRASISRSGDRADIQGRLGQASGSGRWRTAGRYACSGHWTAERRPGFDED